MSDGDQGTGSPETPASLLRRCLEKIGGEIIAEFDEEAVIESWAKRLEPVIGGPSKGKGKVFELQAFVFEATVSTILARRRRKELERDFGNALKFANARIADLEAGVAELKRQLAKPPAKKPKRSR